jgi:hypothetical protein
MNPRFPFSFRLKTSAIMTAGQKAEAVERKAVMNPRTPNGALRHMAAFSRDE